MAKPDPRQLGFDFEPPVEEIEVSYAEIDEDAMARVQAARDACGAKIKHLIDVGLLPDTGIKGPNGGTIQNRWGGHKSISRMHQFPFEVSAYTGTLHVVHPGIEDMPYVDSVAEIVGYRPVYHKDVEITGNIRRYHHAVDLCRQDCWLELLATHYLTEPEAICSAICLKLDRTSFDGAMSINANIARSMLLTLGVPEPQGRSGDLLARPPFDLSSPFCRTEDRGANAWMRVHAWEDGLVKRTRQGDVVRIERLAA